MWQSIYNALVSLVCRILLQTSLSLLFLSAALAIAHKLGWLHRIIWHICETELSKLLNSTPVTIGGLRYDLWGTAHHHTTTNTTNSSSTRSNSGSGSVWATNIVVHAPQRELWQWESPVIVRVGHCHVRLNNCIYVLLQSCLVGVSDWLSSLFIGTNEQQQQQEPPFSLPLLDIETIHIQDVQAFVERRQHIFNFYLLDPHNVLPDPADVGVLPVVHHHVVPPGSRGAAAAAAAVQAKPLVDSSDTTTSNTTTAPSTIIDNHHDDDTHNQNTQQQANQVVADVIRAVHDLGRAAQQGSFHRSLATHRHRITSKLKQYHNSNNSSTTNSANNTNTTDKNNSGSRNTASSSTVNNTKITKSMQEGVRIAQHVGRKVAKKVKGRSGEHILLPERRELPGGEPPMVHGRVGRAVLEDARIFTRAEHVVDGGSSSSTTSTVAGNNVDSETNNAANNNNISSHAAAGEWNRPISINVLHIKAAELCPPLVSIDQDNLPLLYQSMDVILDRCWKRLLAEMMTNKSSGATNRIFSTAMGQVLDFWLHDDDDDDNDGNINNDRSYNNNDKSNNDLVGLDTSKDDNHHDNNNNNNKEPSEMNATAVATTPTTTTIRRRRHENNSDPTIPTTLNKSTAVTADPTSR